MRNYLRLLCFIIIAGCQSWRIDDISDSEKTYAIPLAYGTFGLADLVQQSPNLEELLIENDLLILVYRGDDLTLFGKDFIPSLPADLPLIMTDTVVQFPLPAVQGFIINEGKLKGSTLVFSATSPFPYDIDVHFSSEELRNGPITWEQVFKVKYLGTLPVSYISPNISLQDITLLPTNGQIKLRYQTWSQNIWQGKLNLAVATIKGLSFSFIRGKSNSRVIHGGPQAIPINFFRDLEGGKLILSRPKILLKITNSFGIPLAVQVTNPYASSPAVERFPITSELFAEALAFANPAQPEDGVVVTQLEINTGNSNLAETFAIQPHHIRFDVDFIMNPFNEQQAFWLTDTSFLRIESKIFVPLQGSADYFFARDTVDLNFKGLPPKSQLAIHGVSENQLPLGASLNAELLKADGSSQGYLWPDYQIIATQEGTQEFDFPLPLGSEQFRQAAKMVVHVRFSHLGGQEFAIKSSQTFSYQLGLRYTDL